MPTREGEGAYAEAEEAGEAIPAAGCWKCCEALWCSC